MKFNIQLPSKIEIAISTKCNQLRGITLEHHIIGDSFSHFRDNIERVCTQQVQFTWNTRLYHSTWNGFYHFLVHELLIS